mmetsp:Transcript_86584/g.209973  ORF Transcript_86584/g.209973 Transcript_86584/m.209973 type:complete len:203 (+) Transcript_86584:77-685(+)
MAELGLGLQAYSGIGESAPCMLEDLQWQVLQRLTAAAKQHFQGIASGAKECFRLGLIDKELKKNILDVDTAYHIVRHLNRQSIHNFILQVDCQLQSGCGPGLPGPSPGALAAVALPADRVADHTQFFDIYDFSADVGTQTINSIPPYDASCLICVGSVCSPDDVVADDSVSLSSCDLPPLAPDALADGCGWPVPEDAASPVG